MLQIAAGPLSRPRVSCALNKYRYRSSIQVERRLAIARTRKDKACIAQWISYKADRISRTQVKTPVGLLSICPLQEEDERGASVLLTKSFADKDGRGFREIRSYVHEMLQSPPDGVMLVARLQPSDPSQLPTGKSSVVAGLAVLSFNTATREQVPTLQPPDQAAYLSNIAVDPRYRRHGIASAILQKCELITIDARLRSLYLHARMSDSGAQTFYVKAGYLIADADTRLSAIWHRIAPRVLMYKQLPLSDC